jgi:hypothetical protein
MHRRDGDRYCAAPISNAASLDMIRRLLEYQRGYADGQASGGPAKNATC